MIELLFCEMRMDRDEYVRLLQQFETNPTHYMAYLELQAMTISDDEIKSILKGDFEKQPEKKHVDNLFFAGPTLKALHTNNCVRDDLDNINKFLIPQNCVYEPLNLSATFVTDEWCRYAVYAESYKEAARILCCSIVQLRQSKAPKTYFFYDYNLALPLIYCCRLSVELTIKSALCRIGKLKDKHRHHDLMKLWDSFRQNIPKYVGNGKAKYKLQLMRSYIELLMNIDETGNYTRYPDRLKNYWIDTKAVYDGLLCFIDMMKAIDYQSITKKENKNDSN